MLDQDIKQKQLPIDILLNSLLLLKPQIYVSIDIIFENVNDSEFKS